MRYFGHSAAETNNILKGMFSLESPEVRHYHQPGNRVEACLLQYQSLKTQLTAQVNLSPSIKRTPHVKYPSEYFE